MKIALFYPRNWLASWYALGGYRETLERMGHEVIDCPFPGNQVNAVPTVRAAMPTVEQLNGCDVVLAMYLEYIEPWLTEIYGLDAWQALKVPVIGRFDESFDRTDVGLPVRWERLKKFANYFSFPAAQDAERFEGDWLPYGADMTIFNTGKLYPSEYRVRKYPLAFVGSLYPVRVNYLEQLYKMGIGDNITFHCGQVVIQDLDGIAERASTELLAENYRRIKIFFCLPPMSKLVVAKVVDVMACGAMMMFPRLMGAAAKNLSQFEEGKEIIYYDQGYMKENAKQIRYYLEHEDERREIARAGCNRVLRDYTLEKMLERLLLPVYSTIPEGVAAVL